MPKTDTELVDELLDIEEFDVLQFVTGTKSAKDSVDIYTNGEAAYALSSLFEKEKAATKAREESKKGKGTTYSLADEAEFYLDEDEVTRLREELDESKLTFELKGLLPVEIDALTKELKAKLPYTEGGTNEEYNRELSGQIYVRTIRSVTNAKGQIQRKRFTVDGIYQLFTDLFPEQHIILESAIWKVTSIAGRFAAAVTPDFS